MKTKVLSYFSAGELVLWCSSVIIIIASYLIFGGNPITSVSSVIGVTSLIFCAKGNPVGQILIIIFSIIYGMISYAFSYYGEMVTYLGMTVPMAVLSLISWLKNPYNGKKSEVKVSRLSAADAFVLPILTASITVIFYFILQYFKTANLIPSTISVTTSFIAVYLTFRRSEYYALAYAANDIVLIILWGLASFSDIAYLSVMICFAVFLANDIYGFINWTRIKKRQQS